MISPSQPAATRLYLNSNLDNFSASMLEIISVLWQLCEPSLLTGKIFSIDVMHQLAVQLRNTSYGVCVYIYIYCLNL